MQTLAKLTIRMDITFQHLIFGILFVPMLTDLFRSLYSSLNGDYSAQFIFDEDGLADVFWVDAALRFQLLVEGF